MGRSNGGMRALVAGLVLLGGFAGTAAAQAPATLQEVTVGAISRLYATGRVDAAVMVPMCDACGTTHERAHATSLEVGLVASPEFRVGIEALRAEASITNGSRTARFTTLTARYYPYATSGLYFKSGVGAGQYRSVSTGRFGGTGTIESSSVAVALGAGYDLPIASRLAATVAANAMTTLGGAQRFNGSDTGASQDVGLLTIGVGLSLR